MAQPERLQLAPAAGGELPLKVQRALWRIVEAFSDDQVVVDVDGLADAIARFAFELELVYVPASPALREQGVRFYPVTPHELRPIWLAAPARGPAGPAEHPPVPPSLRSLGAQPIGRRDAQ